MRVSDFTCRVVECPRPIVWIDWSIAHVVGLGWCAVHRPRRGTYTPITVYGREFESWCPYPPLMSVAALDRALARRRNP
jgi:hypothetical protein